MKRILAAFAAIGLLLTCACSGETGQTDPPAGTGFSSISGLEDRTVAARGVDPILIHFTATGFWKVSTTVSWIRADHDYAVAGTYDVKLTVDSNAGSERSGSVSFTCGPDVRTFTVTQKAPEADHPGEAGSFSFRLMSFNILQSTDEPEGHAWATYREAPCRAMFQATDPDIICLQECRRTQLNFMKDNFPQYSYYMYAKDGVKKAGYESVERCDDDAIFKNGGHRDVIALRTSRFQMLDWGRYWFSATPEVSSYAGDLFVDGGTPKLSLWLKVKERSTGIVFYVWDTHFFPSGTTGRLQCSLMSVERMKAQCADGDPVFFCGDLNLAYEHESLKPLRDYMQSAGKTVAGAEYLPTYTGFRTDRNTWTYIDHIFYRNASPSAYKVVAEPMANGTSVCSDHFPIYAEFTVSKE